MKNTNLILGFMLIIVLAISGNLFAQAGSTCAYFDGDGDYLTPGDHFKYLSEYTFEMWVYNADWSVPSDEKIVSCTNNGGFFISVDSNGNLKYGIWDSDGSTYRVLQYSLSNLTDGWHHIAANYDEDVEFDLFVDGDRKLNGGGYDITYDSDNYLIFGAEAGTGSTPDGDYYNGYIDEIRIWNKCLTESEINSWMNKPITSSSRPSYHANLRAYYKVDTDWSAGWLDDASGNVSTHSNDYDLTEINVSTSSSNAPLGAFPSGYTTDAEALWKKNGTDWSEESDGLALQDYSNQSIGNSEFYGVANSTGSGTTTSDCPGGVEMRAVQIWYIDDNANDNINLKFDCSDFASTLDNTQLEAGDYKLLKRSGTSGNFSTVSSGDVVSGDEITFNYYAPGDGYYTIGRDNDPATVTTSSALSVTANSASLGGNVTADGGGTVTARGVCWNTTGSPTTGDNSNSNGSGTGSFSETISSFTANTTYYVRAYATNSEGTSYGIQFSFTTNSEATANIFPANASTDMPRTVTVNWRYDGGGTPDKFQVYQGGSQVGSDINWAGDILYNQQLNQANWETTVNWEIRAFNSVGIYTSSAAMSYSVPVNPGGTPPAEIVYYELEDVSVTEPPTITLPSITLGGVAVQPSVDFTFGSVPTSFTLSTVVQDQPDNPLPNPENCGAALEVNLPDGNMTTIVFGYGSYVNPDQIMHWNGSVWEDITVTSGANFGTGSVSFSWTSATRGEEEFAVNDGEAPVSVNLSAFYALYLVGTPTVYWTTQSEENNAYWNVYRGTSDNFENAENVNANAPVQGNGTTNMATDYIYVDILPVVQNANYWYWIEDISIDGETEVHEPITLYIPFEDTPVTPENYGLQQNYPNPFNPSTSISFALSEDSDVEIIIYNLKGKKIKTIFNDHIYADQINSVVWNGEDENGKQVSSGVYFYKLITNTRIYSKKMLMIK